MESSIELAWYEISFAKTDLVPPTPILLRATVTPRPDRTSNALIVTRPRSTRKVFDLQEFSEISVHP